jgi:hypothetical protein
VIGGHACDTDDTDTHAFIFKFLGFVQVAEEEATAPQRPDEAVRELRSKISAQHTDEGTSTEAPLAGHTVYQTGEGEADSDDEEVPADPVRAEPLSTSEHSLFVDDSALNEEVERLMAALQGAPTATTAEPSTACGSSSLLVRQTVLCNCS